MNRYGYKLKQNTETKQAKIRYHKADLELMTIFQLREICIKEKIVQGMVNPMDKEELIHTILHYRGADEYFLIQKQSGVGRDAIEQVLSRSKLQMQDSRFLYCRAKIVAYQGLAIDFHDGYTIPYDKRFAGSNALLVSGDGMLCAILNLLPKGEQTDVLYLTKSADISCMESEVKNYTLYCLEREQSELFYRIYGGKEQYVPEYLPVYPVPLLDFEIKEPVELMVPVALDFGTANTTAGVFLDYHYYEQVEQSNADAEQINAIRYAAFYDTTAGWKETTLLPSVVGVHSMPNGRPEYLFGYEAIKLANSSYIDEGFCVFYDIKRWIGDYEKSEEVTDREGHRQLIKRKDILKAYFDYVLSSVANQYKCRIERVHISCPVKQKAQFLNLFHEILPGYAVEEEDMIDEGVAVLYNTISDLISRNQFAEGEEYKALILDCGGGTTDLCSGSFHIQDKKPAFWIEVETSYENGDTDFGGNNLTYRVMQLLKIAIVNRMGVGSLKSVTEILEGFDLDIYRSVDQDTAAALYKELETVYQEAEQYIPTQYKKYENRSREEYYKVKNNFYFLFFLAETVKKEFYSRKGTLQIGLGEEKDRSESVTWVEADKWKLSIGGKNGLETVKTFPAILFNIYDLELLLRADVYGIVKEFLEDMYRRDMLEEYSMIKLTGQSCKMELFRDAIKEFVPGRAIQTNRSRREKGADSSFKMSCVDGAIKYLRDKKLGLAHISIRSKEPALPYQISAYTHQGTEVVLIERLARSSASGMISRNVENLTLELYLKDLAGNVRYRYLCSSRLNDFEEVEYEQIYDKYGEHIPQKNTDDIEESEVRFFIWTRPMEWAFSVVPVSCRKQKLYVGRETVFGFENERWVKNFFDGMK